MMAGSIGYGCTLGYATAAGGTTFTAVADIISISIPTIEASKVDITSITQANRLKQYIAGMQEGGMLAVEAYWTPASYSALVALIGSNKDWKITENDSGPAHYTWTGFVTKVGEMTIESDKAQTFKVDVQVTTAVTIS